MISFPFLIVQVMIANARYSNTDRDIDEQEELMRVFIMIPKTYTEEDIREKFKGNRKDNNPQVKPLNGKIETKQTQTMNNNVDSLGRFRYTFLTTSTCRKYV